MTFKNDPACRVFLSTDSGGVGLNLQCASVVVNCDLPWNPARLEQRIARAWRKHQTRNVTVINLVSENTIEHRMIGTLEAKRGLAEGILDGQGDLSKVSFRGGAQAFMTRLKQMMTAPPKTEEPLATPPLPTDRSAAFAARARETLGAALSACEERFPMSGSHSVLLVVVDRDAAVWKKKLETLYLELFGPGQSDPLAPVHLQVVDRSAFEALKQFEECGLIAGATRATRSLYPAEEIVVAALSEDEKRALEETRNVARRKLKAARLLLAEELAEEASRPLRDTIRCLGRAYAMRNRLPLPETPEEALAPHLLAGWGDLAAPLQSILAGSSPLSQPLIERLDRLAACPFAE